MPTPKRLLVEHLYDGDLSADVALFLEEGKSWRTIADLVSSNADYPVSYESLRQWFGIDGGRPNAGSAA